MYGLTIKKIRLAKDLALKSVYLGICSKPNAIQFEKGLRMLAADKFNQVLDNLMISLEEFQWIDQGYQPQRAAYYQFLATRAFNNGDVQDFARTIQSLENNPGKMQRIQLASYRLLNCYQQKQPLPKSELRLVTNYFANLATWTLADVKFFANNCYILPYHLMINLLTEALKVQQRYQHYPHGDEIFATLLLNCADRMIEQCDFDQAKQILQLSSELIAGITLNGFQLLQKYELAKILFLKEDPFQGEQQLLQIKTIAEFLNDQPLVEEINKLIKVN